MRVFDFLELVFFRDHTVQGNSKCYDTAGLWGSWVISQAGPLSVAVLAFCIDVKVRRTDAGYEPQYLPQATEEDHGAHLS